MKRIILILRYFIYYIIGLISFSTISFISQSITIAILLERPIYPSQDLYNFLAYGIYYLPAYSILYFIIVYCARKYDKHIVNKLNENLGKLKIDNKNSGGSENG